MLMDSPFNINGLTVLLMGSTVSCMLAQAEWAKITEHMVDGKASGTTQAGVICAIFQGHK